MASLSIRDSHKPDELAARFWSKVEKKGPDECWLWTATTMHKGYGQFGVNRRVGMAHRISFELANGDIPEGMHVLHRCDNPRCVNPSHLFLGTNADNHADKREKNRQAHGERAGLVRLNADQVQEIRKLYAAKGTSYAKIGRQFGVHYVTVFDIVHRKTWAHVP